MEKLKFSDKIINLYFKNDKKFNSEITITKGQHFYVVKRIIKNLSDKAEKLTSLKAELSGITFGGEPKEDYYYANENARLFCNLTVPLDYDRLNDDNDRNKCYNLSADRRWCDPEVNEGKICSSPYQPFPAILVSNYKSNKGIICGSLSQEVFYHSFETGHRGGKAYLTVYSAFKGIAYREIKPNEELTDIFYIGETENADDINKIFDGYTSKLRKVLKDNAGSSDVNRHTLIWDSWNDGIYRDVSEEMLIKEAKAVKRYFPNVEWFQLDDGYSTACEKDVDSGAHGLGVPYEGENGIDKNKFPNGLKWYTDKIKKTGLKSAVWIGGFCPVKTKIYKDHPEWFIDYGYRVGRTQPLDVSKKEVREYMVSAIDTFLKDYGFNGIKHDFWSYAFEDRHDLLANKDKSGYEWREWWQKSLRKRLPKYGYIETGCDIGMGNPFIGKYFNNYRFGLDVGAGKWERIKTTTFWSVAVLTTHTGDLFIPNSDSIGLLPNLNETDFMFVVNWQIITRTLVEISGRFSQIDNNNPRLRILQRATKNLNNGENVFFAKYDYRRKGEILPEIIYINSAFDSGDKNYKTVAVFNATEEEKTVSFSTEDIGLSKDVYETEFVWTNKKVELGFYDFILKPHGSILLKVKI